MTINVAVDPGNKGGLAWSINGSTAIEGMPDNPRELADLLESIRSEGEPRMFLEQVGGYTGGPGAPGSAMFNFGRNYGEILGVAAALKIPVELVTPQKWQKALSLGNSKGMTKTQWKNKLKDKAIQLFPNLRVTLQTSDALLILHAAEKKLI